LEHKKVEERKAEEGRRGKEYLCYVSPLVLIGGKASSRTCVRQYNPLFLVERIDVLNSVIQVGALCFIYPKKWRIGQLKKKLFSPMLFKFESVNLVVVEFVQC